MLIFEVKSGCLFCMGAYKCDVVVVIKMGTYIYEVLIFCGYLLSDFYGSIPLDPPRFCVLTQLFINQLF